MWSGAERGEGTSSVNKTTGEAVARCSNASRAVALPKSLYGSSPLTPQNLPFAF